MNSTVGTGLLMLAHSLLMDRKHNLHLVCK
jgi:hypothetical protein